MPGRQMQKSDSEEPGGRPDNLEGPVEDMPATASGAFSKEASDSALVVDADRLRQAVFLGGPALLFGLGLLLG